MVFFACHIMSLSLAKEASWHKDLGLVTVLFDVASVVACLWLWWRVGPPRRKLLVPNQLLNLALADLVFSSMEALLSSVTWFFHTSARFNQCVICVMLLGQWTSLFLEVHIAAGFFALFWRMSNFMQCLRKTLLLTWVFALLLVSAFPLVPVLFPDVTASIFVGDAFHHLAGSITEGTFVTTAALYVGAWFKSVWFPLRGGQRAHRMVVLYPATFFFTMAPTVVCARWNFYEGISAPFSALNGFLNVLVYCCHRRFSCVTLRDMDNEPRTPLAQWAGASSLPVGFSMFVHEEMRVSASQRQALQESERETAAIESARANSGGRTMETTSTFSLEASL